MKTITLTNDQLDFIIGCLEQTIYDDRLKKAKVLNNNKGNYEDSLVKTYEEDEEKAQDLHEELAGWRVS